MNRIFRFFFLAAIVASSLLVLSGCSRKTVIPLNYSLVTPAGGQCLGKVAVLTFKDARAQQSLGRDGDGYALTPATDVADWVGWSLYEELNAAGCEVEYRGVREGLAADMVVTGEVLDVRLIPMGKTVWKGMVKVHIMSEKDGIVSPGETFVSEVEKPIIFGVSSREEVLAEALQGVMEQIVPAVVRERAR